MYELFVLAMLMHGPLHGYWLIKIANDMIGPWAKISPGNLYPLLARLERQGLIRELPQEEETRSQRQSRRYAITPDGEKRFHALMMDTSSNLGDYERIFHIKAVHMQFIEPRERLLLVNHYINYCERTILHMQFEAEDMQQTSRDDPVFAAAVIDSLQHFAHQAQGELDWARHLRARIVVDFETVDSAQAHAEQERDPQIEAPPSKETH